jgi:hypothetical protein
MNQYIKLQTSPDVWECECCGSVFDKTIIIQNAFDKDFANVKDTFEIYVDGHFGGTTFSLNGSVVDEIEGVVEYGLQDCDSFPENLNFIFTYILKNQYTIKTEYDENSMWNDYTLVDNTSNEIIYYNSHCLDDLQAQSDVVQLLQQKHIYLYLE